MPLSCSVFNIQFGGGSTFHPLYLGSISRVSCCEASVHITEIHASPFGGRKNRANSPGFLKIDMIAQIRWGRLFVSESIHRSGTNRLCQFAAEIGC
jgi:hypothetical protein